MKMKKLFGQLHLWIGLFTGVIFFLIAFSGAIYSWESEISKIIYNQRVTPSDDPFISVKTIQATMKHELPKGDFRTVLYGDRSTALNVLLYIPGTYYHAFLNPYTGELLHLQDMKKGWLNHLRDLHRSLLMGKTGKAIVHWGTLLFLVMMITGLVLWWPTNKAGRKQRLTIKWGASPQKLFYDLHNVLGFYATWISVFAVITGLFWGFEFVRSGLKNITGETELIYEVPKSIGAEVEASFDQLTVVDSLARLFRESNPNKLIRISNPHAVTDPINITVISPQRLVYNADHYYFDRYTGERIHGNFEYGLYSEASSFAKLHGLVYDVHFGNILGLPGRIMVFLSSLIAASLPITGFIIWWGRRRRK